MDILYMMPNQNQRLFINVVHACPNACVFCVDFKGETFYGFDLKGGRARSVEDNVSAIEKYPSRENIKEVYYCGIGEPLLLYDLVIESVPSVRTLFLKETVIAINTSGTCYLRDQRVDFAGLFDLIQISLNAESEKKYNLICRPKAKGTYAALKSFLQALRDYIECYNIECRVELMVVDLLEFETLPESDGRLYDVPRPNIEACKKIADGLNWPLKVKSLIKDCEYMKWKVFAEDIRIHCQLTCDSNSCEECHVKEFACTGFGA